VAVHFTSGKTLLGKPLAVTVTDCPRSSVGEVLSRTIPPAAGGTAGVGLGGAALGAALLCGVLAGAGTLAWAGALAWTDELACELAWELLCLAPVCAVAEELTALACLESLLLEEGRLAAAVELLSAGIASLTLSELCAVSLPLMLSKLCSSFKEEDDETDEADSELLPGAFVQAAKAVAIRTAAIRMPISFFIAIYSPHKLEFYYTKRRG